MVDKARRNSLKQGAGIGAGVFAMATGTSAVAQFANMPQTNSSAPTRSALVDLVDVEVSTRISKQTGELEVVLTNVGSVSANITDMTPAKINTVRGEFDFDALFDDGHLQLEIGESVSVPMRHHAVVLDGGRIQDRSAALHDLLIKNVSIVTDGDSLAAVRHVDALSAVA